MAGRRRPRTGRRSCRSSQWSGHGTRNTILPGTRIVRPVLFGIRARGTTRCAPRLGRMRSEPPPNGWSGSAAQTPVASTTARVRISKVGPAREVVAPERLDRAGGVGAQAGGPDPGDRDGAGGDAPCGRRPACSARRPRRRRGRAARRAGPSRRRVGASSSVAAFDRRRCQPPSWRAPRMSYSVRPAS